MAARTDGYGEELPNGYVRKSPGGQRAVARAPRPVGDARRQPSGPIIQPSGPGTGLPSASSSLARANALLNPIVQYSFRAGSEGGGGVPQYQYAGEGTPNLYGEALRRFQQNPNRVYGGATPRAAAPAGPIPFGQTQPGESDYQRMLRLAKMAGF